MQSRTFSLEERDWVDVERELYAPDKEEWFLYPVFIMKDARFLIVLWSYMAVWGTTI